MTNPIPDLGWMLQPDSFDKLLAKMSELHRQKRSDYTGLTGDILHNYRQSSRLAGISMEQGMFARLCEKVIRLSSVYSKGGETEVSDEKIDDTLLDLAVISLLMIIAREEGATNGNQGTDGVADEAFGDEQRGDSGHAWYDTNPVTGAAVGNKVSWSWRDIARGNDDVDWARYTTPNL